MLDSSQIILEPTGSKELPPCPHCGSAGRTVWGLARHAGEPIAAYFVQWTLNSPDHGANFDLVLGEWGDGTSGEDRQAVSLEYRSLEGQGAYMVIDASARPVMANPDLVAVSLRRDEVIGTPIAQDAFALVDAIFANDPRLDDIRGW